MANPNPASLTLPIDPETGRWIAQIAADEYLPETVDKAAQGVRMFTEGKTIREICATLHCSVSTLYAVWCSENPVYAPIVAAYRTARKRRALADADQVIQIADDESRDILDGKPNHAAIQRDKLKVDSRLRVAAAHDPDTYGTKQQQVQVTVNVNDMLASARDRIAGRIIDSD
jgi:hypothetical protein